MKAITFSKYGTPDVLQLTELPDPQPGPGQVGVRIKASGVQPVDCAVRSGWFAGKGGPFEETFPQILGNEFAGVIDIRGEGVEHFAEGDEVLGWQTLACYAEYVVVPIDQIVQKPKNMPWEVAGGLSGAGQTAHTALEELGVRRGDTVLIHAAAGAVGTVAVQLAQICGTSVIGTASEPNHDYLRSLGVIPVTYGEGLTDRVKAVAPNGVDAALDAAGRGALEASVELIENRNRVGTLVDFEKAPDLGVKIIRSKRSVTRLEELAEFYADGKLKIHIRSRYPLEKAAEAHREVETGHGRGKVVLLQ
ncbi:MAG: NADP-dependent oxidoreductase [Balneolaceae bacterium]|nr:NADP-dependent oxidoreductase [Balneolaceae bacterium]